MLKQTVYAGPLFGGALLVLLLAGPKVTAQENDLLRLSRHVNGEAQPLTLDADEVTTWTEGKLRIILLKGSVLVQQDLINMRCQRAVVWLDDERAAAAHVLHADVYGEGEVRLESGSEGAAGARALLDLNTHGDCRLKAHHSKVIQAAHPEDALYRAALQAKSPQTPLPPPPPKPTAPKPSATGPPVGTPPRAGTLPPVVSPPPAPLPGAGMLPPLGTPPATGMLPPVPPPIGTPPTAGMLPPVPPQPPPAPPPPPAGAQPPAPSPPASGLKQSSYQDITPALPGAGVVLAQAVEPADAGPVAPTPVTPTQGTRDAGGQSDSTPTSPGQQPSPLNGPPPPRPQPASQQGPQQRNLTIGVAPRTTTPFQTQTFPLPNGEQAIVVTGGIILTVRSSVASQGFIDMEADELVFWTHSNDNNHVLNKMQAPEGHDTNAMEFYLAGNVEIRQKNPKDERLLHADEVYYDVGRNVAVAVSGDVEFRRPNIADPIHFRADELLQIGPHLYEGKKSVIYSSHLPSDPGIEIVIRDATLETRRKEKRSIFGFRFYDPYNGTPEDTDELWFTGYNTFLDIAHVPVFYLPYDTGDARNPLGPLQSIGLGYSQLFGFQGWVTFDMFQLLGMEPFVPNATWHSDVDYLSNRGPAAGTNMDFHGSSLFGWGQNQYIGHMVTWGIIDNGPDDLGGPRGPGDNHPINRGRFTYTDNVIDLPYGFAFQSQVSLLSDANFLEQYYKTEFDMARNQDTFLFVKEQRGIWEWSLLAEPHLRDWVTETAWLPRLDGYLLGQSFFDMITYSTRSSVAYAELRPTEEGSFPYTSTDSRLNVGRFDWWNEWDVPFQLGAFKVVPYGVGELTEYSNYLDQSTNWPASPTDQSLGRVYAAGGVRVSLPLTRLYPDVTSELWNLDGINHKITITANYFNAYSNTPFYRLPQLDRVNDDSTDQALRDIYPFQPLYNPQYGVALQTETLFNPQWFAIRSLVDNYADTVGSIDELQFAIDQRLQTKRGYPGAEHIMDWMTLDLSATYFPQPTRDDFGSSIAMIQYNWVWNIGDRTALVSTGWYDPFDDGARVTTIGAYFNRSDRTSMFLGYRQIDNLQSKAVTAAVSYVFSPKYSFSVSSEYDFGIGESMSNTFSVTRSGTDVQVTLGLSYNAIQNNFSLVFSIVPNLLPQAAQLGGVNYGSAGGLQNPLAR